MSEEPIMPESNEEESGSDSGSTYDIEKQTYKVIQAQRRVVIYPIEEHELDSLSDLNRNATLFYSLAMLSLGISLGCIWDIISLPDPQSANINQMGFIGLCGFVFLACLILGFSYQCRRKNRLDRIKGVETKGIDLFAPFRKS